ncbi:MAG: hypothetical protein K5669_01700 [Lachnospiraceae bacterium]|nr:hypothetical protein [Lachnospiraceae bacterium]
MVNAGLFFGSFLGYVISLLIIVCVAAIGFVIGYNVRKAVDKKKAAGSETVTDTEKGRG